MFKKFKFLIFGLASVILFIGLIAYAQTGGTTSNPNFFKRVGSAILPLNASWDLGSNAVRWANGYFTNLTTANITIETASIGNLTIQKADPSIILDVTTAGDTDYWLGVQDDAGGDDDDKFYIGKGTTVGTTPYFAMDKDGSTYLGDGGATNYAKFTSAGVLSYTGSARPTRYIDLNVGDAVAWGDGASNAGTVTLDHDNTNHRNFARWTSGSVTQDIDIIFEILLPANFSAWSASNSLSVDIYTNNKDNNIATITLYDNTGAADAGISAASILPSANTTWETKNDQPTSANYSAGTWAHLHIHLGNNAANDYVRIGRVYLNYLSSN